MAYKRPKKWNESKLVTKLKEFILSYELKIE
jgi:hypothetical protein